MSNPKIEKANKLIDHSKSVLNDIREKYSSSLREKEIKSELLIKIKNFMETLCSVLDFRVQGLYEKYREDGGEEVMFSYLFNPRTMVEYCQNMVIAHNLVGDQVPKVDIVWIMKDLLPFTSQDDDWLHEFIELNDENSHQNLSIIYDKHEQKTIIWEEFKFKDINKSVIPFLEKSLSGIEKIGSIIAEV